MAFVQGPSSQLSGARTVPFAHTEEVFCGGAASGSRVTGGLGPGSGGAIAEKSYTNTYVFTRGEREVPFGETGLEVVRDDSGKIVEVLDGGGRERLVDHVEDQLRRMEEAQER